MARTSITRHWQISLAAALMCATVGWQAHAADKSDYSGYRTFEQIETQLQTLAKQHPERLQLHRIGQSAGGKALYFLSIAAAGKVKPEQRPALFVGANMAGFHHAGSEAAMQLIANLASSSDKKITDLLATRTVYIAPLLNPDAHAGLFQTPRQLRARNAGKIDHDLDGLIAEDDADDLDGNGIITQMRMKDPTGDMIIDPKDPRRMIKADTSKGERGTHRVFIEGKDDDKDGLYNEDGAGGIIPDRNFAAGFPVADTDAGRWPSQAPETKAIMDALLARPNIAMAVVFGPANQLLSAPTGFERITPPGATPAAEVNKPEADDLKILASLADPYKKSLEQAGLDSKRSGRQTGKGSLANWLYFHFGVQTIELDVWGAPTIKNAAASPAAGNEKKAPADPERDLLAYLSEHHPQAIVAWKKVSLDDGSEVEVGGIDPYAEYAPPIAALTPAIAVHNEQIMSWAGKLGQLELVETKVQAKGNDVWLISAVGALQGEFPSHSKLAAKMRNKIPVRLEMRLGKNVTSLALNRAVTSERLDSAGTIKAEWLVKGSAGSSVDIALWCNQAGRVMRTITLGESK